MKANWFEVLFHHPVPLLLQQSADAALLAVLVGLVCVVLRRSLSAAWRHALWLLVFARLLLPGLPVVPTKEAPVLSQTSLVQEVPIAEKASALPPPVSASQTPGEKKGSEALHAPPSSLASSTSSSLREGTASTISTPDFPLLSMQTWLWGVWALGASAMLCFGVVRSIRLHRSLRRSSQPAPAELKELLHQVGRSLHLRSVPGLELSSSIKVPSLAGLWRPRILLPVGFSEELAPQCLRLVLGHELAHWRRRDLVWQLLSSVLLTLHWFNPLLWLAHHRLREEAEASCDEWMLARIAEDEARAYGDTLLDLAGRIPSRVAPWKVSEPGLLGMAASASGVRRRIELIADWMRGHRAGWRMGLAGLAILSLLSFLRAADPKVNDNLPSPSLSVPAWRETAKVHVFDDATRDPLAGVKLTVESGKFRHEATTDAEGIATLKLPEKRPVSAVIRVRHAGRVPTLVCWHFDQPSFSPPEMLELPLPKAVTVAGTVKDTEGKPVAGAQVALIMRGSNMGGATQEIFPDIWERRVPTDANGHWSFTEAPPGRERFSLSVEHPDIVPQDHHLNGDKVPPFYAGRGETRVKRGATITGRVVDEMGQPVKATIVLGEAGSDSTSYPEYTTSEEGTFRIGNATKNQIVATVFAKGHAPLLTMFNVPSAKSPLELKLSKGVSLKIRVTDKNGKPIAGVAAGPDEWRGSSPDQRGPRVFNQRFSTDKEGRFTWEHAPDATVTWDFFGAEGYCDNRGVVITPGGAEVVITLQELTQIAGIVTDADTGSPIPAFRIVPGDRWEFPGWKEAGHRSWMWWTSGTIPGKDGKFVFNSDRGRGGDFRRMLRISAEGYVPFMSEPIDEISGKVTWDIKLKKSPPALLTVRTPDGKPAVGAKLTWNNVRNGSVRVTKGDLPWLEGPDGDGIFYSTDADGSVKVPPEAEEFGLVVVHPSGWGWLKHQDVTNGSTIMLSPWASLELDLRGIPPSLRSQISLRVSPVVLDCRLIAAQLDLPKLDANTQQLADTHLVSGLYNVTIYFGRYSTAPQIHRLKPGETWKVDTANLWKWCQPVIPLKLPPGAASAPTQRGLRVELDVPHQGMELTAQEAQCDLLNSYVFKKKDADGKFPETLTLVELGAGSYRVTGALQGWPAGTPHDQPAVALAEVNYRFTIPPSAVRTPEFVIEQPEGSSAGARPKMKEVPAYELPPLEVK